MPADHPGVETLARSVGTWSLPEDAVAAAGSVRAAAQAVVDDLGADGLMPSVYVEQDGRLRCQAARGYWQIFDGMPPSAGVIGRTYRTGVETVIRDVRLDPSYLTALAHVRAEVCVPLVVGDAVAGVLNVEAAAPLSEEVVERVRGCAELLARRMAAVAPEAHSPAQRLARRAARLAHLTDPVEIQREAVGAVCALSGLSSAMLVMVGEDGEPRIEAVRGPRAPILATSPPNYLRRMAGWVEHGTSAYTAGDAASTLVVLPLEAAGRRLGFLAAADDAPHRLLTEDVELLELLATQVAAGLRVATAVIELRERASTDPLTGLGHHGSFHGSLGEALAGDGCVALALVDLDSFKALNDTRGHRTGDAVLRALAQLLREALPPGAEAFRIGGDEFALLFPDGGAGRARATADALRAEICAAIGSTVSVGIAQAAAGEPAGELVERADAALYAVKRGGRDGVQVAPQGPLAPPWQARLF